MKHNLLKLLFVTLFAVSSMATFAQLNVSGTVVDATGEPVIGANIVVKGSTQGTITDFDGNYSMEVTNGSAILVFSYIGMQAQELSADAANGKVITLKEDTEVLEEQANNGKTSGFFVLWRVNVPCFVTNISNICDKKPWKKCHYFQENPKNRDKMHFFYILLEKYLYISKKCCIFAAILYDAIYKI